MLVVAARFAIAIVLDALAFTIWDVGSRSPSQLFADVVHAPRSRRSVGRGMLRFVAGFVLLIAAALVVRPLIPTEFAFSVVEMATLVVALTVEALVGSDLRRTRLR